MLMLISKVDRSSSERVARCQHMSPVYWSSGGNFLAAPENKHINIMNVRGQFISYLNLVQILDLMSAMKFSYAFCTSFGIYCKYLKWLNCL